MGKDILLVIDLQNDFCMGGPLEVENINTLFTPLNNYIKKMENRGNIIAFTKDWHPVDHLSFITNGGKWPVHCLANSEGANLHSQLYIPSCHFIIHKGIKSNIEGYSAFEKTNLESILKNYNINNVIICGLATSYCVAETAISSTKLGFNTTIIKSLTRDTYNSNSATVLDKLSNNYTIDII